MASPAQLSRQVYAGYFALQAVAGIGFWAVVALSPTAREVFEMSNAEHGVTDSFLVADVAIGILGAAVAAAGIWRGARWAGPWAMFVAGGMVYATLYLVAWVGFTGDGAGLLALMVVPSTLSAWTALQTTRLT